MRHTPRFPDEWPMFHIGWFPAEHAREQWMIILFGIGLGFKKRSRLY